MKPTPRPRPRDVVFSDEYRKRFKYSTASNNQPIRSSDIRVRSRTARGFEECDDPRPRFALVKPMTNHTGEALSVHLTPAEALAHHAKMVGLGRTEFATGQIVQVGAAVNPGQTISMHGARKAAP